MNFFELLNGEEAVSKVLHALYAQKERTQNRGERIEAMVNALDFITDQQVELSLLDDDIQKALDRELKTVR